MKIKEKRRIVRLLQSDDLEVLLAELASLPPSQVVNALISGFCSAEPRVRWHAITAMGQVVAAMAETSLEDARVVMRRLTWSLNDESGGIGWGAPEAIGEILACHAGMAEEYTNVLVAYMREDGFFLELPELQRGLMWGIGRLAQARPALLDRWNAALLLRPYLNSNDPVVRGNAAWALGLLADPDALPELQKLLPDNRPFQLYRDRRFYATSAASLATEAIKRLKRQYSSSAPTLRGKQ